MKAMSRKTTELAVRGEPFTVKLAVPGMEKKDLKVEVRNGVLSVSGERRQEHREKIKGAEYLESSYGSFTRSMLLPETVDARHLRTNLAKGVLQITIPARAARSHARATAH